jgi:pimeloyl-ACP methyl ester carboxylesterase
MFARRADEYPALLCADADAYRALKQAPNDADPGEWDIEQARASEAAARMLWPIANTRLAQRLPLIEQEVLIAWGAGDQIMPRSYAQFIASSVAGQARVEIVEGAGHLVEHDKPAELARLVLAFTQ